MKTTLTAAAVLTASLTFAAGVAAAQQADQQADPQDAVSATAMADLRDAEGNPVGQVTLTQYPGGVVVRGELDGLPPGWHGLHIHETGQCEPSFDAAGGHFNPTGARHGLNEGQEPHAGDLANIWASDAGVARFEMMTDRIALQAAEVAATGEAAQTAAEPPAPTIFDEDGAVIVVHAEPDDYVSDPSGAAGDRIACGAVQPG